MARTIIKIEGKRFQVCQSEFETHPCKGCFFFNDENLIPTCGIDMPCLEFDYNSEYYHILKELNESHNVRR